LPDAKLGEARLLHRTDILAEELHMVQMQNPFVGTQSLRFVGFEAIRIDSIRVSFHKNIDFASAIHAELLCFACAASSKNGQWLIFLTLD
jgi:hypothetical protein